MKTTLPENVMLKITDTTEQKLKKASIPFKREGTTIYLATQFIPKLLDFQTEATQQLIQEGIITTEMIEKELENYLK